jgi:Zn-finger nucleic acid-binding protein
MPICPKCNTELNKTGTPLGFIWVCPSCNGRAIAVDVLRKTIPNHIVDTLWQTVRSGQYAQKRRCPACKGMMAEVAINNKDKTEYIDVCKGCFFIWFDPGEYEDFPKVPPTKAVVDELPAEAKKLLALDNYEAFKERQEMVEKGLEHVVSVLGVAHPALGWWGIIRAIYGLSREVYERIEKNRHPDD